MKRLITTRLFEEEQKLADYDKLASDYNELQDEYNKMAEIPVENTWRFERTKFIQLQRKCPGYHPQLFRYTIYSRKVCPTGRKIKLPAKGYQINILAKMSTYHCQTGQSTLRGFRLMNNRNPTSPAHIKLIYHSSDIPVTHRSALLHCVSCHRKEKASTGKCVFFPGIVCFQLSFHSQEGEISRHKK